MESQDAAVIVKELLETAVRATTLQFNLDVVLELSLIRRSLLHVDHGSSVLEGIGRVVLSRANINFFIGIEGAGEVIAVDDTEHTAVHVQVHTELKIRPVVVT